MTQGETKTDNSWQETMRRLLNSETKLAQKIEPLIMAHYKKVANTIRERGVGAGVSQASTISFDSAVMVILFETYQKISIFFARATYRSLTSQVAAIGKLSQINLSQKDSFPDVWERVILEYLNRHGVRFVNDITEETRRGIISAIGRFDGSEASLDEIARALESSTMPRVRARRIARTEITRAVNAGILVAAATMPFETEKEWITAADERVRVSPFSHNLLHGQKKPLREPFNNGQPIRFPGDPSASAENVINCRCILNILPLLDARGVPVPRNRALTTGNILDDINPLL